MNDTDIILAFLLAGLFASVIWFWKSTAGWRAYWASQEERDSEDDPPSS